MEGMLEPIYKEHFMGRAEVLKTFRISRIGTVAGSMVNEGRVERGAKIRVLRDNVVINDSKIDSLRRLRISTISRLAISWRHTQSKKSRLSWNLVATSRSRKSLVNSSDNLRIACCDCGYDRPSVRPRVSNPATYCSSTPRTQSRGTVARWAGHLHYLATAIRELSELGLK
jgi:hypothetical protein